jgi:GNAT superfamily N-acetyltransferase
MKLVEISTDQEALTACSRLLQTAFPQTAQHTACYLQWLYRDNPAGTVVGYNAWDGEQLVGHYAGIPVDMHLNGDPCKGLLALHTAMHPDYRSAGIIYSLAKKTCNLARERGYACIYAVANAVSTPIFVKALGFQYVCQLTASVGWADLRPDWETALSSNRFRRHWSAASANWRAANPSNPSSLCAVDDRTMAFTANTPYPLIRAYGLMLLEPFLPAAGNGRRPGLNLFLGLFPEGSCSHRGYITIPERLKPSPLNFIYRPLSDTAPSQLSRNEIILGLQDFDPY